MIITLAGHVDHGKTAIVQALTGVNTDRLKEEQARGLTIDLGFAYTTIESQRIGFVDVPGHHRFIHNMIAGVANQQHALLVIAADDGIMPQTTEHAQILELIGLRSGTIVLNKVDLVSADRLRECRAAISQFKSDCFLRDARVFEVVAPTNDGIEALRTHLVEIAQTFDSTASARPFRLAIDRSFNLRGVGTVVTGTVTSGEVRVGDEVHLTAIGDRVRIRNLNVQGLDANTACAGDRCSLNIAGSDANEAQRGDWLLSLEHVLPINQVSIDLSLLDDFPRNLKHWSSVHVYHLTDHTEARLALLEGSVVEPGARTLAELHCDDAMHFKAGDRLILRDRDQSCTIGGATILAYAQETHNRRRSKTNLSFLDSLRSSIDANGRSKLLETYTSRGLVSVDEFKRFTLCAHDDVRELLESDQVVLADGLAIGIVAFDEIVQSTTNTLGAFHDAHPSQEGMTVSQLEHETPTYSNAVQFTLDQMVNRQVLRHVAGQYALRAHRAEGPSYDTTLFDKVKPMFDAEQPVSLGDVAKRLRKPFNDMEKAMRPMVAAGTLVRVNNNRYLTPERIAELQNIASQLAANEPFTVREFRDASGLGRNTVIDVLEYFDRQRVTQRRGEVRVLLKVNESNSE